MTLRENQIDAIVGQRVRTRRRLLGMSQTKLADGVALSFQQIQKYERGANRMGSSRLHQFSEILDVPISYFFQDLPDPTNAEKSRRGDGNAALEDAQVLTRRETLELVRAYFEISEPQVRKRIRELVRSISRSADTEARR